MSLVGSYGTQHPHIHVHPHLHLMGSASGCPPGSSPPDSLYAPAAYYSPHPTVHPYQQTHHHHHLQPLQHHNHQQQPHQQQSSDGFLHAPSPVSSSASSPPSLLEDHQGGGSSFYGPWGATPPGYNTPSTPSAPAPSAPTSPEEAFHEYGEYQQHVIGGHYQLLPHQPSYGPQQAQQGPQEQLGGPEGGPRPFVRVVKRRNTANKKERRRTQSINTAFADLRDCIPNVPSDTKLSKIKTLRLATSYIAYLMGVLASEDPGASDVGFKAEIMHQQQGKRASSVPGGAAGIAGEEEQDEGGDPERRRGGGENTAIPPAMSSTSTERKAKGRTGWPQHVWALELKP
ncbi:heart- and neural crest derivatives-expressed protein 2 [Ischnura elegans]|uniref:heart- and neural crest derivatives-expressed protein 2 n=1 Tax=Ischnura elegans TaxID=197161 RepID=UPI001ED87CF5|nr:heart- and neural crest derivatives-expressed protein 2 [Ischnura elegans]